MLCPLGSGHVLLVSITQKTQDVDPVLGYIWASVEDAGPDVTQHWAHVLCIMGGGGG